MASQLTKRACPIPQLDQRARVVFSLRALGYLKGFLLQRLCLEHLLKAVRLYTTTNSVLVRMPTSTVFCLALARATCRFSLERESRYACV